MKSARAVQLLTEPRTALSSCFYAIPDGKPLRTFPGIALFPADHALIERIDRVVGRATCLIGRRFGIDHPRRPSLGCGGDFFGARLGILAVGLRLLLILG